VENLKIIKISVRKLVEFVLRQGDIKTGTSSLNDLAEGTRIHRKLQKAAGEDYKAEVRLGNSREFEDLILEVNGIADGIIDTDDGVTIDEIKSVKLPVEMIEKDYNFLHWAQAMCYGYFYSLDNKLEYISVQLTYYSIKSERVKQFIDKFTFEELEKFYRELTDKYYPFAHLSLDHLEVRNSSIKKLVFPFQTYRKGQREMSVSVYKAIKNSCNIFIQAPTGIGKTVSALFPAMKAIGEGYGSTVFYITAKSIAGEVAENAFNLMQDRGLKIWTVTLTAKEKICPNGNQCTPDGCGYVEGHFTRVNDAIYDILCHESVIVSETILQYSEKHCVCPFEYGLDISEWVDCIICDYNYVFDPRAHLRRYFDLGGDYILLADESHNLVDRAREMFSAQLDKREISNAMKLIKPVSKQLYDAVKQVKSLFTGLEKEYEGEGQYNQIKLPEVFTSVMEIMLEEFSLFFAGEGNESVKDELLDFFFNCISFNYVCGIFDDNYRALLKLEYRDVILKLFCIDPSVLLRKVYDRCRAIVFFSATLLPEKYYKELLGGVNGDEAFIRLKSPFDTSNLCLMIARNVSARYKDRALSYEKIVDYIKSAHSPKVGNYFIYFPSYEYMRAVYQCYTAKFPEDNAIMQESGMTEQERDSFLLKLISAPKETLLAFGVMGGIFAEGIDLPGDRLSGTVIIGVGLPQISFEREVITQYFTDEIDQSNRYKGYDYSYVYPGFNRVLQAAGRVIRSETDRGFVLLLDDRFAGRSYSEIFPAEWYENVKVSNHKQVYEKLVSFWG
jgi:DNA excision repair protein ERCC-2